MKNLDDFQVGDKLLITHRTRNGYDTRSAEVFCINYNGNKMVTYTGRNLTFDGGGFMLSGSGAFNPETIGKKPFGIVAVCVVSHGTQIVANHYNPQPGDRGYDLMC